jgi:hypothetical protein
MHDGFRVCKAMAAFPGNAGHALSTVGDTGDPLVTLGRAQILDI